MEPVKFVALDRDDLEVVSAHLQDAVVKVADVHLAAAGEARWWSRSTASTGRRPRARSRSSGAAARRCASSGSTACKCRNVDPAGKDAVLNLLAVEFAETDPPAGVVTLIFSGGGCCGSRSSAWRPNWPISGRPGPSRRHVRVAPADDVTDARG